VRVERPVDIDHDGTGLCSYGLALARMRELIARPAHAEDLLISVQHPPTITVGRRGGAEHIHARTLALPGHEPLPIDVHEVARGGSVTWHAPGQAVVYPIVQLPRWTGDRDRLPLGDLPRFVRTLEAGLQRTCADFGLATVARPGFAGLWGDDRTKIASIGVAVRGGWSFHGVALNVNVRLEGFDLITPCALGGVRMTSLWQQLQEQGRELPRYAAVERRLVTRLSDALSAAAGA